MPAQPASHRIGRRAVLAAASAMPLAPVVVRASSWPDRPIRFVVPYAAGGTSDLLGRLIANALGPALGQTMVVENRPGGGATVGAASVAQAAPDGYTLLLGTPAVQATNRFMMASLPYDPDRAFTPIVNIMRTPNLLVVHPSVPAHSVAELIALCKRQPDTLFFGSSGVGSTSHLAGEMLRVMAKIEIAHAPFRGTGPNVQALLSGEVKMSLDGMPALLPHIREGRLRLLAVTTPARYASLPDTPAVAETLPGFDAAPFNYITGPAGLPQPIVERVNTAMNAILNEATFRSRFQELGFEPMGGTPAELAEVIRQETARWGEVIRAAGIRIE
ncbi:tripartite tricarboxylate transporter substrate binding protein [Siccirubricoccus sp. KC 17139]|uniref:Tripartite tricarboxylate transporter substrate binding protein n=1 Tax=Siccirubricoccus soli TaxID=2899147 RepID=A0ABT1D660_9PROT|nr:tripartite tricarboxylate transporter substrate binding protein [Siccirubricoccus soli]MCO6417391.1 tripartite tricarboxylate transporter substrate binding protein [Siccirubricoccus soli]MCP2683526.1 tripartite tricarboxylate transporter substrate binding protein [Siccirubricoccus soli]